MNFTSVLRMKKLWLIAPLVVIGLTTAIWLLQGLGMPEAPDRPWLSAPAVDPKYSDRCGNSLSGVINGQKIVVPTNPSSGSGYQSSYGYPVAPPTPANPVAMQCQYGTVVVHVATPQHFGYRIADLIPVRVWIKHTPRVCIDYSTIKDSLTLDEKSDFDRVAEYSRRSRYVLDAGWIWQEDLLEFKLQSFRSGGDYLTFKLDVKYFIDSNGLCRDTSTTEWLRLRTPDLIITTDATVDQGTELVDLPVETVPVKLHWLTQLCLILAVALAVPLPVALLRLLAKRLYPLRFLTPPEVLWEQIDAAMKRRTSDGRLTLESVKQIEIAVRRYFDCPAGSVEDVIDLYRGEHPDALRTSIQLCEQVLFDTAAKWMTPRDSDTLAQCLNAALPKGIWTPDR